MVAMSRARAWRGSTRRKRLPPGWEKTIVPRILKRDGGICHVCKKPGADDVDHVHAGDDHRDENLAAIHRRPCHARKSGREGGLASPKPPPITRPPEKHPGIL